MKDSDYIIIDTPELKDLFAPKQATDEYWDAPVAKWSSGIDGSPRFTDTLIYRRLRSRAWLKIVDKPVQYPCWLLHQDVERRWFDRNVWSGQSPHFYGFTDWQPAPAAPGPPSDPDEDGWKMVAADYFFANYHKAMDKDALLKLFDEAVKAGQDYERSKPK